MKRREFILLVGGATAAWPLAASGQQGGKIRRIGYLTPGRDDARNRGWITTFERGLKELGWTVGRDVLIDYRFGAVDPEVRERHARDMVAQRPEVILAVTPTLVVALLRETQTIPIVFVDGPESAISAFVADRSHPGGNVTGFINFVDSMFGKWVQLLKEIAPNIDRIAYLVNPDSSLASISSIRDLLEAAAQTMKIGMTAAPVRDSAEIEAAIAALSAERRGGLIVLPGPFAGIHRQEIFDAAIRHGVAAIYPFRYFANDGGLFAYGVDENDLQWRSASYVDRILKGANPGDLPVQAPTKFELVLNMKAARAIGLEVPPTLLARADEVIE
jgi:putative tryptophan/tyrosine transport system substrate-binding protein